MAQTVTGGLLQETEREKQNALLQVIVNVTKTVINDLNGIVVIKSGGKLKFSANLFIGFNIT